MFLVIEQFLKRRHFWRYASFDEVASLYTARFLRQTAGFLINMFVAVYMYELGYKLQQIALFYICYFGFKAIVAYGAARFAARFGPKHGMLMANVLSIPALVSFSQLEEQGAIILLPFMLFQATSITLYTQCHNISFSKVKNAKHAGKEIGFMVIIDKLTAGISPLLGGIVAWQFGPQVTIWLAAILYCVAALPLLRTAEPVVTKQKIRFSGFPWRATWRSLVANMGVGADYASSSLLWPLFLAAVLFADSNDSVYAKIGGLVSITLIVSFVASWTYGKVIDRRRGGELLKHAVAGNALVHLARVMAATPFGAAMVNVISEITVSGYIMAFTRAQYDQADRTGRRIAYLYLSEVFSNVGYVVVFGWMYLVCLVTSGKQLIFTLCFMFVSLMVLNILRAQFPLYRK